MVARGSRSGPEHRMREAARFRSACIRSNSAHSAVPAEGKFSANAAAGLLVGRRSNVVPQTCARFSRSRIVEKLAEPAIRSLCEQNINRHPDAQAALQLLDAVPDRSGVRSCSAAEA